MIGIIKDDSNSDSILRIRNEYFCIIGTRGKFMRQFTGVAILALLFFEANPAAFSQLRNLSEYQQDCINTDQTYFALRDTGAADYKWVSEWTHITANGYPEKSAILLWYFKDGTRAYSRQGEYIGDTGGIAGYLQTNQSSNLQDVHRKSIQPMTRENYPVKLELWIGEIGETTGFSPENLVDTVCFDEKNIEFNKTYHFSSCPGSNR